MSPCGLNCEQLINEEQLHAERQKILKYLSERKEILENDTSIYLNYDESDNSGESEYDSDDE